MSSESVGFKLVPLRARRAHAGLAKVNRVLTKRLVMWNGHSGARVLAYKPVF